MFKRIFTLLFLLTGIGSYIYGQTYSGPAQGSVTSGATVSTDDFSKASSIVNPTERIGNEESEFYQDIGLMDFGFPTPKEGSNYYQDPNGRGTNINDGFVLKDFPGIPDQGNIIPPDCYCAVGPDHVIATVNSRFRIFDKDGNVLKTIDAQQWFNNVFPNASVFDPKIIYDMFDNRWVIVWLEENDGAHTSTLLVSVSDDDNPLGTWYNWALPSNLNGSNNSNTWTDYHGLGYDQNALYVTCNQFAFGGYYQYEKIRIIPKAQLYANTAGTVTWNDLWNIGLPPGPSGSPFHLRPAEMHTASDTYYLIWSPWSGAGNFVSLYKITDPLGTPALTGINVPTTLFYSPPNANQLGGGSPLIDAGAGGQNEPKYKDGYIYYTHAVRNPTATAYSAVHYLKINTTTNTADQDYVYGDQGFWYLYPSVDVDQDNNVGVTFSRSGDTEYIGAFFTTRLADDPPGFNSSIPIKVGEANYVKTFGDTRNRWGDYNGIQIDPSNQNNFWLFTEYAASPQNTWGTWVGEVRAAPFQGPHIFTRRSSIHLDNTEINTTSSPKEIKLFNFGSEDLVITAIPDSVGPFHTMNVPSGTITVTPFDSLAFDVVFSPTTPGIYDLTLTMESNDPDFTGIDLDANGYIINQVTQGTMYASSGTHSNGVLFNVDLLTGGADSIGTSDYDDVDFISSVSINPATKIMYGLYINPDSAYLLRVNPTAGDAYVLHTINLPNLKSIAFDTLATLYAIKKTGEIYTIDLTTGGYTAVGASGVTLASISFDPTDNQLYASALVNVGSNKDRLYRIELPSGTPTVIGNTGFGVVTNAIEFDADGNLYGAIGSLTAPSDLISIDKTTGIGTTIGSMGYPEITGLAYARSGVTGVKPENNRIPNNFTLNQNFPNPFNPSTTIEYSLPVSANVTVTIYNLLGEVVNTLINGQQNAGFHSVNWNSNDNHGSKVGSGVYFYELKANGSNGAQFTQIRKMVLLK